nr:unnamed protein product [Digitaria exilis]
MLLAGVRRRPAAAGPPPACATGPASSRAPAPPPPAALLPGRICSYIWTWTEEIEKERMACGGGVVVGVAGFGAVVCPREESNTFWEGDTTGGPAAAAAGVVLAARRRRSLCAQTPTTTSLGWKQQ